MIICYLIGKKYFPVPYKVKKIFAYWVVMLLLYFARVGVSHISHGLITEAVAGIILMSLFLSLVFWAEKKEIQSMRLISRFLKKG
jgi:hypothetical protein